MSARAGIVAALTAHFSPRADPDGDVARASDAAPSPRALRTQPDARGCASGTSFSHRLAEGYLRARDDRSPWGMP